MRTATRPRADIRAPVLVSAVVLLAACGDATPTASEPAEAPRVELVRAWLAPAAIRLGEGTTTLRLEVRGPHADSLHARPVATPDYEYLLDGRPLDIRGRSNITLYDDGTRGDERAGDGIYATDGLSVRSRLPMPPDGPQVFQIGIGTLVLFTPEGAVWHFQQVGGFGANMYGVPPDFETPAVRSPAPGVRVTDHAVHLTLSPDGLTDEGGDLRPGQMYFDGAVVANAYFRWFPDDRDFLIVSQPFPLEWSWGTAQARFAQIRNETRGIGDRVFDASGRYGSDGRLRGQVMFYAGLPSPSDSRNLVHELNHHWSGRFDLSLGISDPSRHWGYPTLLAREYNGFDNVRYNDFELYLMGALPADSVQPRRIGRNGLTLDELIGVVGVREPGFPDAPRAFTAAFVHVDDQPLDDLALAVLDDLARRFGSATASRTFVPFEAATGGRATLDTRIPEPLSGADGS